MKCTTACKLIGMGYAPTKEEEEEEQSTQNALQKGLQARVEYETIAIARKQAPTIRLDVLVGLL